MITRTCTWAGVTATIYYLDKGEKVPRHQHPVEHSTFVVVGSTHTRIFKEQAPAPIWSRPGESVVLPANIDHEITATEDGTIVLNMIAGDYQTATDVAPGQHGGVMLHDGTVVPHGA